jgi:hypothetical protein
VPQSQDALLALLEDTLEILEYIRKYPSSMFDVLLLISLLAFPVLTFFWAFQTFYWARFVSRLQIKSRRKHYYPPPILDDARIERLNERIPRHLGTIVFFSVWLALLKANWWNTRHELALTAMMAALLIVYIWMVRKRRKVAGIIHQRLHLTAFLVDLNFKRDLEHITLEKNVRRFTFWLATITLVLFLVSGYFAGLPKFVAPIVALVSKFAAPTVALVWTAFGLWAVGHICGIRASTRLMLRLNIFVFGATFLVSIVPSFSTIDDIYIIRVVSQFPSTLIIMLVAAAWVFIGTFFLVTPA